MGTNYYAKILPSKKRKDEIKKAIDDNDFNKIKQLIDKTYGRPYYDISEHSFSGGEIHLGKRSSGWKFLWNPNWYKMSKGHLDEKVHDNGEKSFRWIYDGYDVFKYYDLTKDSIKAFIDRDDVEIYDEDDEKQDKKEFYEMAINWGYDKDKEGFDDDTYEEFEKKQNPNYMSRYYKTDYCCFLTELGFKLNKCNTDFYSDGMRFSTCTEFS
jgi:hypothetical protein